jgi:hypothetical protein
MTETQLCHFHVTLCHTGTGFAEEQLGVQSHSSNQFESPLASVTGDLQLLADRRCKSPFTDSQKHSRG